MFRHAVDRSTAACLAILVLALAAACAESPRPTPAPPEVIAQGEELFQRTAGGVGCASCHGANARGGPGASNIVGKDVRAIERALSRVNQMRSIELDRHEIEAVAAYLQTLR